MSRVLMIVIVFTTSLLTSCTQSKKVDHETSQVPFKQCPEERPQMCTKEYRPVCANRDTGVRCVTAPCPSIEQKTYGNGCTACADEKVSGYISDACASEPELR